MAIAAVVAYYPMMITHIFGDGYRGEEAFSNLKKTEGALDNFKKVFPQNMYCLEPNLSPGFCCTHILGERENKLPKEFL